MITLWTLTSRVWHVLTSNVTAPVLVTGYLNSRPLVPRHCNQMYQYECVTVSLHLIHTHIYAQQQQYIWGGMETLLCFVQPMTKVYASCAVHCILSTFQTIDLSPHVMLNMQIVYLCLLGQTHTIPTSWLVLIDSVAMFVRSDSYNTFKLTSVVR